MDLMEFKIRLLDTGIFRKVSTEGQYRCQSCPFCGDNNKHMYVKILMDNETPVMYYCQRCNAHGWMNERFLSYYSIDNLQIPKSRGYKRIHPNNQSKGPIILFDENQDQNMLEIGSEYIQKRVGVRPSTDDLKAFQLLGNPEAYVREYLGDDIRRLRGRVWFRLSNGNIIGRLTDRDTGERWLKYNSTREKSDTNIYIIKRGIDPYQTINICICEGVMDAIGLYYHGDIPNAVYIACLGRGYTSPMRYVIGAGIFGDSVNIRFYLDNDVRENPHVSENYALLFKSIGFYRNTLAKDFGYPEDRIMIEKYL